MNFEKKVKNFIHKNKMVNHQDKIIIGVSGGADSVCLLFTLKDLRDELRFSFEVVHVNHGLRGESANQDEAFVKEYCAKLNVPCHTYHVSVKELAKMEKLSTEEAGRVLRRKVFEKVMKETGSNKVALAHHQNDNAETLLMNLARGSGLRGVSGMKPVNGHYIRPLLGVTREEIEGYLKERKLSFCVDETNKEIRFARNRIRNVVVPNLEQVNGEAVSHMNEAMAHLREVEEFVESKVEEEFLRLVQPYESCIHESMPKEHEEVAEETPKTAREEEAPQEAESTRYGIKVDRLLSQPSIIQKAIVKKMIEKVAGEKKDISRVHVEQVLALLHKQVGKSVNLPYKVVGFRDYQEVIIAREEIQEKPNGFLGRESGDGTHGGSASREEKGEVAINIPGITKAPAYNIAIECRWIEEKEGTFYKPLDLIYTKAIDYDIIKGGLFLRMRAPGDTITVDKKGSQQKLKSYFINEKIPKAKRGDIPLLVDGSEVVWVIGYRMNMKYQIKGETKRILEIKVHHI